MKRKTKYRLNSRPQTWPFGLILAMSLTLNFQGQIWNLLYLNQKWSDCHKMKSKYTDRSLGLKCDHQVWPGPWPWPWIFKVKYGIFVGFFLCFSGNIFSTTTKKRHNAKFNVCCNSSNLIYCLTCGTCEKQYVGMTKRKLKQRLYEHLRSIRQGNLNDPIGRHFSKVPHNSDPSKVKVHVLSFITHPPDSRTALNMRLRFELDWIHRLRTTLPRGLNAMD